MTSTTISGDWNYYQSTSQPGWWAIQNPWNNGGLVNGQDYTQTITVNPSAFPDQTVLSWTWPNYANSDGVWGYPEVVYGSQAGTWQSPDGQGPTPVQIKNLSALTGSYNLSLGGNTDQYDVLWETHLTSAPDSSQVDEFGIFLHTPSYLQAYLNTLSNHYSYNEAGLSATIIVTNNGSAPYIIVEPTQGDMLSGTVDMKSILDFLVSQGVLTGNEYIEGFEMGAEPRQGSGSLTINSLGYDWNGNLVGSDTLTTTGGQPPTGVTMTATAKNGIQGNVSVVNSGSTVTQIGNGAVFQSVSSGGINQFTFANITNEQLQLGSAAVNMTFANPSALNVTGGSGADVISANSGTNTFSAGAGTLDVSGGKGKVSYLFHNGDGMLRIEDFSVRNDSLTIDRSLQSTFYETSDGNGGLLLAFGSSGSGIDLIKVSSLPESKIHFV